MLMWASLLVSKLVWPGRATWYATSSYEEVTHENEPQKAIDKDRRTQWRGSLPQKQGDWFEIDMSKLRLIAGIEFVPDAGWVEKPEKWRMMFYGRRHEILTHKDGSGSIVVEGDDIPQYIRSFMVQIQQPAADMPAESNYSKRYDSTQVYWSISYVRVLEYRFALFGKRFCKHDL